MSERLVAMQGLETTPLEEGVIIFHPKSGKFVMFNRSAALVWAELGTPKTEEDLIERVSTRFSGVEPAEVRRDVREVLDRLRELELVSPAQG